MEPTNGTTTETRDRNNKYDLKTAFKGSRVKGRAGCGYKLGDLLIPNND